jgi:hypothetical protein
MYIHHHHNSNIGTYSLSGIAASAVIARVLFGRVFRRDPEAIVRVSIENLMAQLVGAPLALACLGLPWLALACLGLPWLDPDATPPFSQITRIRTHTLTLTRL